MLSMNCRNQYLLMENHPGHLTLSTVCLKGPVLAPASSFCMSVSYSLSWNATYQKCTPMLTTSNSTLPSNLSLNMPLMLSLLCKRASLKWVLMDKLMLNDEKTEFIVIGIRQQLVKVNIDSLCVGHTAILPSFRSEESCWLV